MRYDPPLQLFERWVLEDGVEVAGVPIPRGEKISLLFGSANRDPRVFASPDEFDVARPECGRAHRLRRRHPRVHRRAARADRARGGPSRARRALPAACSSTAEPQREIPRSSSGAASASSVVDGRDEVRRLAPTVYNAAFMFDIGSSLREARLRQNLDFPELEERTKIRPKYLRALEDERFDILPAPTYVRGFLRSYAEALGLDGQPFVDEYNSRFTVGEDDAPLRARRAPLPRRDRGPRESRMAAVALVAIADRHRARDRGLEVRRAGGREGAGSRKARARVRRRRRRTRRGRCTWSCARSTAARGWRCAPRRPPGKLLYSGTLEQGQRKPFDGRSLQLALAEPDNVVVRVNGNRVDLPDGTTFVVTAQRITRATS